MRDRNVCPIIFRTKLPEKNIFFTQKRLEGTNSWPVDHTIQNFTAFIVKSLTLSILRSEGRVPKKQQRADLKRSLEI